VLVATGESASTELALGAAAAFRLAMLLFERAPRLRGHSPDLAGLLHRCYLALAAERNQPVGFITVRAHFPGSGEIHHVAVHAANRGKGVGRHLLVHAEAWLREQDAPILQAKTPAAVLPSPECAQTRRFCEAMGCTLLEVFPTLWGPKLPALQLVKSLSLREDAA